MRVSWSILVQDRGLISRGKFFNDKAFSLFTFCTIANQQAPFLSRDQATSRIDIQSDGENHGITTLSTFGRRKNILLKNL